MTKCPICEKDISNPNSKSHVNSKYHQDALKKEYANMKPEVVDEVKEPKKAPKKKVVKEEATVLSNRGDEKYHKYPKIKGIHLKTKRIKGFKNIVETLKAIIDETMIIVTPDSIKIKAIDPSHICMLQVEIKRKNFTYYNCTKEYQISTNLDDFDKIMKRAANSDEMEISANDEDAIVKIVFKKEGSRKRTFTLRQIDLEVADIPVDKLLAIEHFVEFEMDVELFDLILKDAEIYSECLNMKTIGRDTIRFSSQGAIGETEAEIDEFERIKVYQKATGDYSVAFLKALMKLNSVVETFTVSFRDDHPLQIRYILVDGEEVYYWIGPRMDQGEEDDDDDDINEYSDEGAGEYEEEQIAAAKEEQQTIAEEEAEYYDESEYADFGDG